MTHHLSLNPGPFRLIAERKKHVEMRLFDKKRQAYHVGDILVFTNTETSEVLKVIINDLKVFPSFKELYEFYPHELLGYEKGEQASYHDMEYYYSLKSIEQFGAFAITIALTR